MSRKVGLRRAAFTLIELLVSIAILAMLVAILLPSLEAALDGARCAYCLKNLQNLGIAATMYSHENDDLYPRGNKPHWFLVFLPYLPEEGHRNDFRRVKCYLCPNYPNAEERVNYVISDFGFRKRDDQEGYSIDRPTPLWTIDRPSLTIYLADNEDGWWRPLLTGYEDLQIVYHDVWKPCHLASSDTEGLGNGRRVARARHKDGCNALYFDGHSAWVKASTMDVDMWRDHWGDSYRCFNPHVRD